MARFVLVSLELNPRSEFPLIAFNRKLKPSWAEWSSCFLQASPKFRGMTWKIALTWFMYICVCPTAEREQSAESELLVFSLVSGSPYYDNVRPLSYPDSDAVLICFDISRPETLDSVLKKVCHIFFPFFFMPLLFKRRSSSLWQAFQLQTFPSFDLVWSADKSHGAFNWIRSLVLQSRHFFFFLRSRDVKL